MVVISKLLLIVLIVLSALELKHILNYLISLYRTWRFIRSLTEEEKESMRLFGEQIREIEEKINEEMNNGEDT